MEDAWLSNLIKFHSTEKYFDCRIIDDKDYRTLLRDNGVSDLDFGIYGARYLYISQQTIPGLIEGRFSTLKTKIDEYCRVFDRSWEMADTFSVNNKESMDIEKLYRSE